MSTTPPATGTSWKPSRKITTAALTAVLAIVGGLVTLYSTGTLNTKTGIAAVFAPLLPVLGGYLKSE